MFDRLHASQDQPLTKTVSQIVHVRSESFKTAKAAKRKSVRQGVVSFVAGVCVTAAMTVAKLSRSAAAKPAAFEIDV